MFCVWTNQKYVIPDFGLFTCVQVIVGALKGSLSIVVPLRSSNPDPVFKVKKWYLPQCSITDQTEIAIFLARTRGMAWLGEIVGSFLRHV